MNIQERNMSLKYEVTRKVDQLIYRRHYQRHRLNGPASIWQDGDVFYREYGLLTRANLNGYQDEFEIRNKT